MQEQQLKQLLKEMSLKEKIGQLIQLSGDFFDAENFSFGPLDKLGISEEMIDLCGSVLNVSGAKATRRIQDKMMAKQPHNIPILFMLDVIYGYKTILPSPLGLGSSWNPALVKKGYECAGKEANAGGIHVAYAPMVDIVRDARWGRALESPGEDPYLNGEMGRAMVEGFQKNLSEGRGVAACFKHFAAYGAVESGREYNSVDMSVSKLFQDYLPPYKACVESKCKMAMTSLSTLNGIPASGDKWLLKEILRKKWGFDGVIISDYSAISELVAHGFAENNSDAAIKALDAGTDIDMKSPCYATALNDLVTEGRLDELKIDEACYKVLKLKNDLGLFENPYRGSTERIEAQELLSQEKRKISRKLAEEGIVLLKNNGILPLEKEDKYALIGPFSEEKSMLGMWAVLGEAKDVVSIKEGLDNAGFHSISEKGTDTIRNSSLVERLGFFGKYNHPYISNPKEAELNYHKAIEVAKTVDTVILTVGEDKIESGEAASKTNLHLHQDQLKLVNDIRALGKKIVLIVIAGRPLVLTDIVDKVDAIVMAWYPGVEAGNAIANILSGNVNPSGKLSITFPADEGQEPIYYSQMHTGRAPRDVQESNRFVSTYLDCLSKPLYPFGYGLSYSKIVYSDAKTNKKIYRTGELVNVSVKISNKSNRECKETVQLYFNDPVATIAQPVKRLIGFRKITMLAGESKKVTFKVTNRELCFFDNQGNEYFEPGEFIMYIGSSSEDCIPIKIRIN